MPSPSGSKLEAKESRCASVSNGVSVFTAANAKAGEVLSDEQKAVLRWDDQADYLARTQLYPAPDADLDIEMQDLWLDTLSQ